jgi:hypothetical protein
MECISPASSSDALEVLELLFRVVFCFGIIYQLFDEGTFATGAREVVGR